MERRLAALSKCKELDFELCLVVHMAIRFWVYSFVCWHGYHIPFPLDLSELLESDMFSFQYQISVCVCALRVCVCVSGTCGSRRLFSVYCIAKLPVVPSTECFHEGPPSSTPSTLNETAKKQEYFSPPCTASLSPMVNF